MHVARRMVWAGILLQAFGAAYADNNASTPVLKRTIPLPGVRGPAGTTGFAGRIDHLAYDSATGRLFVAAVASNTLEVIDLDKGERIKSIVGLQKPRGIAVVAATGLAVVACGGDNTIHAYDTRSLEEKAVVPAGESADNVRYDPRAGRVYVGCGAEKPGVLVVFDARSMSKVGELPLPMRPTSFQLDPVGDLIFANMPGPRNVEVDGQVVAVDRNTGKTAWLTTLKQTARNAPMAFDEAHGRVFIACRKPAKLITLDARTGRVIAEAACVPDSDDMGFDAKTNRVIVIGGGTRSNAPSSGAANASRPATDGQDAAIDLFQVAKNGELTRIDTIRTVPYARTGMFVPERRAVYLAVPPQGSRESEIREYKIPD